MTATPHADAAQKQAALTITGDPRDVRHDIDKPIDWEVIRRVFRYMGRYARHRNRLIFAVCLRALQLPLLAWMLGVFLNEMLYLGEGDTATVVGHAALYLGLAAFTAFTLHFRQRWASELGEMVTYDMRQELFAKLQAMPMSYFDRTKLGRIISRMGTDIMAVRLGVQNVLFQGIVGLGQMIVAATIMFLIDPFMFLIVGVIAPIMFAMNQYFRKRFSRAFREMQESASRVTATLAETVNGIRVTQGYVREDVNANLFSGLVADHAEYNYTSERLTGVFMPLLMFNRQLFMAALISVGAYKVISPDWSLDVGDLVQFFFLAGVFFSPIQILGQVYTQAMQAMAGAERVFKLFDTPPQWQDPPDAIVLDRLDGKVQFKDLGFAYVEGRPVLHDINFTAEPGQLIALVGATGSGKTSIINLIAKFYLPTEGQLLIDDKPVERLDSKSLHRHMGIVLQQNFLFSGSVLDNIRMGRPDATEQDAIAAAEKLGCLDLFQAMPDGFDTEVGERGGSLSLGQRQLVCFARAMIADPAIIILDEATSSVDTMTEARIQSALAHLLENRTSFVVAHRLSTIRHADCVLVLDHGRIIERGAHTELLAIGGVYANLYRQFVRGSDG